MEHSGIAPTARRRSRRFASVAAAGAVAASMTLAACGSSRSGSGTGLTQVGKQSAEQAVATAFGNLGRESGLRVTLSLPISTSQVQQLARTTSSKTLPPGEARAISSGSIFFSFTTGHGEALDSRQTLADKDNSVDVGLTIDGNTPVEIRYVGQALYARARIDQLFSDIGQPKSPDVAKVARVLQIANQYVPGLGALGQGKWVELSPQSLHLLGTYLKQFEQQALSLPGATSPSTLSRSQILGIFASLKTDLGNAIKANTTFADLGSSNGRTEYSASINLAGFVSSFLPLLQKDLSGIPGLGSISAADLAKAEKAVPPGMTAVADLYVSGSRLSEADLDVTQFMKKDKPSFPVPVRLAIDNPGSITAPSGAVQLDLSKLPALIQGLFGSLGGSSSSIATSPS